MKMHRRQKKVAEREQTVREPQTALKMCEVKLVDVRKMQGQKDEIPPAEGQQCSVSLGTSASGDDELMKLIKRSVQSTPGKSSSFGGDQKTLHTQLKMISVRLVDYEKLQNKKAIAELELEDAALDHRSKNNESSDQRMLHEQLKMSSVRLVDCRKIEHRKAESEPEGKGSQFGAKQQMLAAQLNVCLVKLVDCRVQQRKEATAEGEPGESSDQEDESSPPKQTIERNFRKRVAFMEGSSPLCLSTKQIVLCKGQMVFQCNQCSENFSSSLDFKRHVNIHRGSKSFICTLCRKRFSQRSQLRRHRSMHL